AGVASVLLATVALLVSAADKKPAKNHGTHDSSAAAGAAVDAFAKMKTLVGKWEARDPKGEKIFIVYELAAGDTTLVERFSDDGSQYYSKMMTMYYVNGDHFDLTHYCIAKNQPTMRAVLPLAKPDSIEFRFLSATNLVSPTAGHMHHAVFQFVDADHFVTTWTFRENGKDTFSEKNEFVRVK